MVGFVAGAAGTAFAAGSATGVSPAATDDTAYRQTDEGNGTQNGSDNATDATNTSLDLSTLSLSALDAARIAANETGGNGTTLAVRLRTVNSTPGYEVLVTDDEGNVTGVVVDARNGDVIETRENLTRLNTTVLQQEGVNVSDIRGAVEAIQTAQEDVGDEFVPVEVAIEAQPGLVAQQVTFVSPNATQHVVVNLTEDSVISVGDPIPRANATGTNDTSAGNGILGIQANESNATANGSNATENASAIERLSFDTASDGFAQFEEGEGAFGEGFGEASEYGYGEGYGDESTFAENDEFDTNDGYGLLGGGEEENGGFLGGGEREEGGGFLGEESEGGWF